MIKYWIAFLKKLRFHILSKWKCANLCDCSTDLSVGDEDQK